MHTANQDLILMSHIKDVADLTATFKKNMKLILYSLRRHKCKSQAGNC